MTSEAEPSVHRRVGRSTGSARRRPHRHRGVTQPPAKLELSHPDSPKASGRDEPGVNSAATRRGHVRRRRRRPASGPQGRWRHRRALPRRARRGPRRARPAAGSTGVPRRPPRKRSRSAWSAAAGRAGAGIGTSLMPGVSGGASVRPRSVVVCGGVRVAVHVPNTYDRAGCARLRARASRASERHTARASLHRAARPSGAR